MKKRNILSLFIVALCAFVLVGISDVYATGTYHVVCSPESIGPDDTAECYVIGNFSAKIEAVVATVKPESKNLQFFGIETTHGDVTAKKFNKGQTGTELGIGTDMKNYTCNNNDGCYVFYAKSSSTGITPNRIGASGNDIPQLETYSEFTNVGYFSVGLTEDATLNDCGSLCLDIYEVTDATAVASPSNVGNVACGEIKPVGGNPDTGSFTSYAVLIGGACIAIAAIALARKNNKFYKI